jgi:hypothetical protein
MNLDKNLVNNNDKLIKEKINVFLTGEYDGLESNKFYFDEVMRWEDKNTPSRTNSGLIEQFIPQYNKDAE